MTAIEELNTIAGQLPTPVLKDIYKRIGDWLASGGGINDPYIEQQLRFAKRFVAELTAKAKEDGKMENLAEKYC